MIPSKRGLISFNQNQYSCYLLSDVIVFIIHFRTISSAFNNKRRDNAGTDIDMGWKVFKFALVESDNELRPSSFGYVKLCFDRRQRLSVVEES